MSGPSEFVALFERFIELYRHSRADLALALSQEFSSESLDAEKRGNENTVADVEKRALLQDREVSALLHQTLHRFPPVESDILDERFLDETLEQNKVDINAWAEALGVSREQLIPFLKAGIEKDEAKKAEMPDFHVYFAWDFASRIDTMVARISNLEEIKYRDVVSATTRKLLQQAHICYINGFEAATVIMCGAILEQTLKDVLQLEGKLEQLLGAAEGCGLLTPEQWGMGDDVRELRNYAIHDLPKFLKQPEHRKATILSNTRAVVGILLSGNSDSMES